MSLIFWIESQPSGLIAVTTFALLYLIAACIVAMTSLVARYRVADDLKMMTPVLLTPLSVIGGLLIAFLAGRIWTNVDNATALVTREATSIQQASIMATGLPSTERTALQKALHDYLLFIDKEDWPAMVEGRASLGAPPQHLTRAMEALLQFRTTDSGQRLAQERAIIALERALEAQRARISLSSGVIAPEQWLVIFVLDILAVATLALVHIDRRWTAGVGAFVLSTAFACCLTLLMIHDRPYHPGGFTLQPEALRQTHVP